MMEIERPKIDTASLSADGRYGKFVVEPLERGFGTTLGNSLRRVLLSSLPGVAVTSIKIDGVVHEFSTIEGVKEDVTEIVLNVKGITAKLYSDTPKTVRIEASGEGEVTAGSIQQDAEIEVLNPDWHIATLADGAKLIMELVFDKGRGYVPAERNKQAAEQASLNALPVDSIYTPVLKVNYTVDEELQWSQAENGQVSQEETEQERRFENVEILLTLTDGTVLDLAESGFGGSVAPGDGVTVCSRDMVFSQIIPMEDMASISVGGVTFPIPQA